MIIYNLCKFFLSLVMPLFSPLFELGEVVFIWDWVPEFLNFMKLVFYIVPVYDLLPLIRLIVILAIMRILISLIRFIFDAIPLY